MSEFITVGQLITELKKLDPKRIVVLQIDPEGNGYWAVRGVDGEGKWVPGCFGTGSVMLERLDDEAISLGYTDADVAPTRARKCIVIFP